MPAERRSLRSNKSDASANGDAGRSNSQNSASNTKGKPAAPTRSASGRSKAQQAKKVTTKAANGDQPQQPPNGSVDPVENGVNSSEDVEMGDGDDVVNGSATNKQKQDEDGDDEMTVVVPPSKALNSSGGADKEQGDIAMEEAEVDEAKKLEENVNAAEKALTGKLRFNHVHGRRSWVFQSNLNVLFRY